MHDDNVWAVSIDLIILSRINVIYDHAYFSHEFFCTLVFGHIIFPRAIIVEQMIHFPDPFDFDI